MSSIQPGSYAIYAWDSVPNGAYQNAEFMQRYSGRGTGVVIEAGARVTASLTAIRTSVVNR